MLIEPRQIVPCLLGYLILEDGDYFCEGMAVLRFEKGEVSYVGCDGARHGTHMRFGQHFSRLREKCQPYDSVNSDCEKCNGSGWLPVDTAAARRVVVLSLAMGLFRGIVLGG